MFDGWTSGSECRGGGGDASDRVRNDRGQRRETALVAAATRH